MPDEHYENIKLAQIYDLGSPWSIDREFYLSLAEGETKAILDLGCGTGLVSNAYAANGHDVTGVDPAKSMLDVARQKLNGKTIQWVHSTAQNYRSDKRFDLIIMTGNAFQCLEKDKDIIATFETVKHHLKPDGIFVFETRNPAIDWKKKWDYEINLDTPIGPVKETRIFRNITDEYITFEVHYQFPDETLISKSTLKFSTQEEIEKLLDKAELYAEKIFGDWEKLPFNSQTSEEMVFIVRGR